MLSYTKVNPVTGGRKKSRRIERRQKIWIEPRSKTTLYDTVDDCSAANNKSCEYVTWPMVSTIGSHSEQPITPLPARALLTRPKNKTITIHLSTKCPEPPSGGIGPDFGVTAPPSLFR